MGQDVAWMQGRREEEDRNKLTRRVTWSGDVAGMIDFTHCDLQLSICTQFLRPLNVSRVRLTWSACPFVVPYLISLFPRHVSLLQLSLSKGGTGFLLSS